MNMTQEEKQLLLKDLCVRLPYGVKCKLWSYDNESSATTVTIKMSVLDAFIYNNTLTVKPYLRPISSLTAKECDQLFKILDINEEDGDWLKINDINVIRLFTESGKDFYEIAEAMDYLYSIHVDFKGMIEKGLALEAPKDMYKTE